jgi:hypothetical protein
MPERVEGLGEDASNAVFGEVSPGTDIAATSEGGLGAGPPQQPSEGELTIVQFGVPDYFIRAEREEDEVWQAQLDIGG